MMKRAPIPLPRKRPTPRPAFEPEPLYLPLEDPGRLPQKQDREPSRPQVIIIEIA
jgi:hypothetical protein